MDHVSKFMAAKQQAKALEERKAAAIELGQGFIFLASCMIKNALDYERLARVEMGITEEDQYYA